MQCVKMNKTIVSKEGKLFHLNRKRQKGEEVKRINAGE